MDKVQRNNKLGYNFFKFMRLVDPRKAEDYDKAFYQVPHRALD